MTLREEVEQEIRRLRESIRLHVGGVHLHVNGVCSCAVQVQRERDLLLFRKLDRVVEAATKLAPHLPLLPVNIHPMALLPIEIFSAELRAAITEAERPQEKR